MKKYTILHMAVFCAVLCFLSVAIIGFRMYQGWRANVKMGQLQSAAMETLLPPELPKIFRESTEQSNTLDSENLSLPPLEVLPKYQELYAENQDLIGWLEIPETQLNLPVMYTPWGTGDFYLYRLFDKTESLYGLPYVDARCTVVPQSDQLLLHGHHMRDGTMFSTLIQYEEEAFFKAHPKIRFDTIYEEGEYEILSVFQSVYDPNDEDPSLYYRFIDAESPGDFANYVDAVKARSLYETGVTATYGDQLITLITCSYHTTEGRMNVVARRKAAEIGE